VLFSSGESNTLGENENLNDMKAEEIREMKAQTQITTATLAVVFGMSLMAADALAEATGKLDVKTARELAIIARVLEKRLGEARKSFTVAATSEPLAACPVA